MQSQLLALSAALALKAAVSDVYSKVEVDTAMASKADVTTTYSKVEVTTALDAKADATAVAQLKTDVTSGMFLAPFFTTPLECHLLLLLRALGQLVR
jgi:hypothetical protein